MAHMLTAQRGRAKSDKVSDLLAKLTDDLRSLNLSQQQRDAALEELKVLGRDPKNADPIFTTEGIHTLTRHAFSSTCPLTSRNALKVLCNALLLEPKTRQMFVDLGYEDKACMRLQNENWEDKFLLSRLIFLTTYGTNVNLLTLIDQHHLADSVIQNLSRHVERATAIPTSEANVDPMEGMALGETLRLLFNVTHFCPQRANSFTPAIPHIITLLCTLDVSSPPLSPPMGSLVNALMNLELDSTTVQTSLFPLSDSNAVVARLVHLLSSSLAFYKETELEQTVTPLVGVIRRLHDLAPEIVKRFVRDSLLPTEQDRQSVLGKGESLSARLLQNTVNPMTPGLRDTISHLFFELSGRDASKLVQNIGYGFAAGYLFQNNIPIPESATDAYDNANSSDGRNPVNPITGQFLESENQPELPEMTGEEKEREAERLFVLFERLKRNGLIQVQNPVAQAVEECRFEELGDDGDEATLIESFNDKQSDIR